MIEFTDKDFVIAEQRILIGMLQERIRKLEEATSIEATARKIEEVRQACLRHYDQGYADGLRAKPTMAELNADLLERTRAEIRANYHGAPKALKRARRLQRKQEKLREALDVKEAARTATCLHSPIRWCYDQRAHPGLVHRECWDAHVRSKLVGL